MPLPTPILDDRSYQQLRDELLQRIPVYAPEWTDLLPSDPGVTLVELFAFLGENLLFRFNQIPDATKLAFLRLLDVPLRPSTPATTLVGVATKTSAATTVAAGAEAKVGALSFSTTGEVTVLPLEVQAFAKSYADPPAGGEEKTYSDRAIRALVERGGIRDDEMAIHYVTQAVPADPSAPGAEAVPFSEAVDGMLWLAVISTKETAGTKLAGQQLSIGFVPDEEVPTMAAVDACPGVGDTRPTPPVAWQVSTGRISGDRPVYAAVRVEADSTRGLSQRGVVQLRLPTDPLQLARFPAPDDPDLAGTGDSPPVIDDAELADKVLFWLRAFREGPDKLPTVVWVTANGVEVEQLRRAAPEFVGTGTGDAAQRYRLINKDVAPGTVVLQVEEPDGWRTWKEVDGFQASGEEARYYTLDSEGGEVRFGDGVRGRAPQIGERIRTTGYRFGGGAAGNVPAGALAKLEGFPSLKLVSPLPGRGGQDAETIGAALDRVPGEIRRRDRAVTASDFQELALATPGSEVGRAECLPRFRPRAPREETAGAVSVVVWPKQDAARPNAPMPGRTLLRSVCQWLDRRRLVTTELYAIPPTYRKIAVSVGVAVKSGYGIEGVRRWVELVVRQYLAPLPPYGPAGEGWPLGRRVHGPELEAAALQVEGVEYLEGLRLAEPDENGVWVERTPVTLERWEVPELSEITVVEGPPLRPGDELGPPPPEKTPVPIPTIRETC